MPKETCARGGMRQELWTWETAGGADQDEDIPSWARHDMVQAVPQNQPSSHPLQVTPQQQMRQPMMPPSRPAFSHTPPRPSSPASSLSSIRPTIDLRPPQAMPVLITPRHIAQQMTPPSTSQTAVSVEAPLVSDLPSISILIFSSFSWWSDLKPL